jgi:hypothetical protein
VNVTDEWLFLRHYAEKRDGKQTLMEWCDQRSSLNSGFPVQYEFDGRDAGIVKARVDEESAVAGNAVFCLKIRRSARNNPRLK